MDLGMYSKPKTAGETKTFRQPFFLDIFLKGITDQRRQIVILDAISKNENFFDFIKRE